MSETWSGFVSIATHAEELEARIIVSEEPDMCRLDTIHVGWGSQRALLHNWTPIVAEGKEARIRAANYFPVIYGQEE